MLIQRVNRTDAEKVFISVKNGSAAVITTGMGVRFLGATAAEIATSTDGCQVLAIDADPTALFAGVAAADIASLGVGLSQVWGYVNSIMLSAEANKTVGCVSLVECFLKNGAVAGTFTSAAAPAGLSTAGYRYVLTLSTTNISGGVPYAKGFVRAL